MKVRALYQKAWKRILRLEEELFQDHASYYRLLEASEDIPASDGSRFFSPFPYTVGIVCDEFVFRNFESTCRLVYLPADWREDMLSGLDLLLAVTSWRGIDGSWEGLSLPASPERESLIRLMRTCRARQIPTVFYSKEDPPNYSIFLLYAKQADVVLTSAEECVPAYRWDCGHDRVFPLLFAVNPLLNNPLGTAFGRKQDSVLFAGSWMKKYPERIREQARLFHWIEQSGVPFHILDRNSGRGNPAYRYPRRWQRYVMPSVLYETLPRFNKLHDWVLNLNSVTDSATMFSMRTYDALACGCLVLSNGSAAMERLLPEVKVIRCREDLEVAFALKQEERRQLRRAGIRRVMDGNTVFDRMAEILNRCGMHVPAQRRTAAVLARGTEEELAALRLQFQEQTYKDKVFVTDPRQIRSFEHIDALALWKCGRSYDPHYLQDHMDAFKYVDCDFITSRSGRDAAQGDACFINEAGDPYSSVFWLESVVPDDVVVSLPENNARMKNGVCLV